MSLSAIWWAAMVLTVPLVLDWRAVATVTRRLRTWVIMIAASAIPLALPTLVINAVPVMWIIGAYVAIDFAAGWLVLRAKPSGCAQKTVGILFGLMASFSIGFFVSSNGSNVTFYANTLTYASLIQWACLAAWGVRNVGKAILADRWRNWAAHPNRRIAR